MRSPRQNQLRKARRTLAPAILSALLGTLGCSSCHQLISTSISTIGANGGTLHSDDCGFTLVIPPGALPQDVPFVLQTSSSPSLPPLTGRVRVSKDCSVSPVIPLAKPATVTQTYDPTQLPPTVSEGDVDLRVAPSAQKEVRLQSLTVDTTKHQATATTTATGDFFATSPQGPQAAEIDITPSQPVALAPTQTQQYSASVLDDTGEPDPAPVTWSVAPARVATIDSTALLTAVAPGIATVTASAGGITATVQVYVLSTQPSPAAFDWENPRPQGNDIHGLSSADGQLLIAANNGTVLAQLPDGGFTRLSTGRGLALAGAALGGDRLGTAGTLDIVQQSQELIAGVLVPLEPNTQPQQVSSSNISPVAVYGDDAGVIAVGSGNDAYLLRRGDLPDAGWVALETPVSEALIAVDADPAGGRRVIGARGQVYREDDVNWFPIWDQPLETLFSQAVVLGHDGYATNAASTLQHFVEGQGWQPDATPPDVALNHVSMLSKLDGALALGAADTQLRPHLWTRDDATWSELPGIDVRDELYAAADVGPTSWVGGTNGALYIASDGGLIPMRTGPIEDIAGISVAPDGSTFAVTSSGCGDPFCESVATHLLVRAADGTWSAVAGFSAPVPLHAVAARSSGDVFIAGEGGFAWHYDGTHVTPLQTSATTNLYALAICGGDVWMAGASGLISLFDGAQSFNPVASAGGDLYGIACTSDTDVWAVGDYTVVNFDGSNWNNVDTGSVNGFQPWRAISVSADEVWITGETDYLLHFDRDAVSWDATQDPAGLELHGGYGLWEAAAGELYLVGSQQRPRQAVLLRYDGAQWSQLDATTDHELFAISGSGPGQFVIGGRGGAILSAETPPTSP